MRFGLLRGTALVALCIGGAPLEAETLRDALVSAYNTNPTLTGSRAGQRATDEGVAIAKAGARPTLDGNATYTENLKRNANAFTAPERLINAGVGATLPIYQGGAVKNGIRAAEARVDAGRANLRSDESSIFTSVVTAYMDVIRDQAIVELNANNVKVLETNLQATRDRFQVGDLTRTDVAQSEARLAIAQSQLESSQAQLVGSREFYLRVVGHVATTLDPPPPLPQFPATADDAVDVSIENNPNLIAAKRNSQAAGYDIRVARAARLPRISATADGSYINYLNSIGGGGISGANFANTAKAASAGAQLTLPLYQGGLPAARVRQAQAVASQQLEFVVETERAVIAQTRAALSSFSASQAVIRSSETAVSANELALEGVRAEQSVGTRDVLDVLNAEQELLNSRVQLVTARHDSYVAGFNLLAALGRAEARDLGLDGVTLYDPVLNYDRVRNRAGDWRDDPAPTTQATRTIAQVVGPQGPVIVPPATQQDVTPAPR
jgi:outer membrane protein